MIKLTILVIVCIKISTGYYEEFQPNSFPTIDNSGAPTWPMPVYFGEPQVRRRKPCPHRRSNNPASDQWVQSFRSMVTQPLNNNVLEPQALKNENVDGSANDDTKVAESLPVEPSASNDGADPNNVKNFQEGPNRRSNDGQLGNNNSPTVDEDYDCDIDLNSEDYSVARVQLSAVTSGPLALKSADIGHQVIEILKDCLNKKQKHIEDQFTQFDDIPLAGSRRSMGDADVDNENNDSDYLDNSDDKELTTDANENTSDELTTTDSTSNVPSAFEEVNQTPSLTLRPGKLFNELQKAAHASGIAKYPVSRRMQEDNSRVCYACSTATNPTCWEPDSRTTIKFCHANQNCITKRLGETASQTIIRDCAESCDSTSIAGIEPKYKTCNVCYKDLCNSAAINSYNLLIIFIIAAFKCTF